MSDQKLIVVIGATGTQGSSVVKTLLEDPTWRIRGVTRNTNSDASKALTEKGVEMVSANLDDTPSLEAAFQGARAIFAVTDFWHPFFDPANQAKVKPGQTINAWAYEYEVQQAKNIFDAAAKIASLDHFIFSSLSSAKKWSKGKYTWVYHFDSKADAVEYMKEKQPELWKKTSLIVIGMYLSNSLNGGFFQMRKTLSGAYETSSNSSPATQIPYIATDADTGPFVQALLSVPPGKNLLAYREWLPGSEFRERWSRVMGKTWTQKQVSFDEVLRTLPEPIGREIAETMAYVSEFGYEGRDDPTLIHPKDLGVPVKLPSVEDWIRKQDWSSIVKD